jgi:superfamily I DNA/RNA helicase
MTDILQKIKNSKKNLFVGLAGPGTGKTYTFRTIIESDEYKEKKILVLSFINKLVDDLSEEFQSYKNVRVSTLHSFAKKELEGILTKIEKKEVSVDLDQNLDEIISEDNKFLKGTDIIYKEKFYNNNLRSEEEKFYKERRDFYKHEKELYSFNSIIGCINKLFEKYASMIPVYDLILVDEFQDFNKLECELIKLLNKRSKILVVGDDNQSLYDFKNAKPQEIRDLYKDRASESFSLDGCYRCTEVIVNIANELIDNAKKRGYLKYSETKKFLYPRGRENKDSISNKYSQIDLISATSGNLLIYKLSESIKKQFESDKGKRFLILVPSYLKQTIYDGLIGNGLHIVDFELFSDEECNKKDHKYLIETFETLLKRKTDNLSLRKILFLYLSESEIKKIIRINKKIWFCLSSDNKKSIEKDIEIFKKVKIGKEKLNEKELIRFDKIFTIKNVLSKFIKGFKSIKKDSIEVEMTTVTSSKGLNVDFVYYIGIDDRNMFKKYEKDFSDQKICEFLVGITRPKEKLTLVSLYDENPKILEFISEKYINRI